MKSLMKSLGVLTIVGVAIVGILGLMVMNVLASTGFRWGSCY